MYKLINFSLRGVKYLYIYNFLIHLLQHAPLLWSDTTCFDVRIIKYLFQYREYSYIYCVSHCMPFTLCQPLNALYNVSATACPLQCVSHYMPFTMCQPLHALYDGI